MAQFPITNKIIPVKKVGNAVISGEGEGAAPHFSRVGVLGSSPCPLDGDDTGKRTTMYVKSSDHLKKRASICERCMHNDHIRDNTIKHIVQSH